MRLLLTLIKRPTHSCALFLFDIIKNKTYNRRKNKQEGYKMNTPTQNNVPDTFEDMSEAMQRFAHTLRTMRRNPVTSTQGTKAPLPSFNGQVPASAPLLDASYAELVSENRTSASISTPDASLILSTQRSAPNTAPELAIFVRRDPRKPFSLHNEVCYYSAPVGETWNFAHAAVHFAICNHHLAEKEAYGNIAPAYGFPMRVFSALPHPLTDIAGGLGPASPEQALLRGQLFFHNMLHSVGHVRAGHKLPAVRGLEALPYNEKKLPQLTSRAA